MTGNTQSEQSTAQQTQDVPLPPDLEYMKNAGEDVSAFLKEAGIELPAPQAAEGGGGEKTVGDTSQQTQQTQDGAAQQTQQKQADGDDDTEPGEIAVGDDGRVRDAKGRFVPKAAYTRQRERATTAESEAQRLRETVAVLNTKLELATKAPAAQQTQEQPKNPFDEPDVDPNADLMGWAAQQQRRLKWANEQHTTTAKQTQEQLTEQGVVQAYRADVQRYVEVQPDYKDAYVHLVTGRAREMIALGMTDQQAVARALQEEEAEIVRDAVAAGQSPAERLYRLAVARGYQKAQPQQTQTQQATTTQQTTQQTQQQAAGATAAEETVARIQAGQETGTTLTGAGAGGGAPGLTLQQYLDMSVDDIIKLKSTPQGMAQLRAIGAA